MGVTRALLTARLLEMVTVRDATDPGQVSTQGPAETGHPRVFWRRLPYGWRSVSQTVE